MHSTCIDSVIVVVGPGGVRALKSNHAASVSRAGPAVRPWAGKETDLGLNPRPLSFLFVSCGLWTLSGYFVHYNE